MIRDMIKKIFLILIAFFILFNVGAVYAAEYGSGKYSCGLYGIGCEEYEVIIGGSLVIPPKEKPPESDNRTQPEITVEPSQINVNLVVNSEKEYIIKVTNLADVKQIVMISQQNLDNMIILTNTSLELEPKETKELIITFVAPNETGIYTGKIIIGNKEVLASLNIMPKPFDSNINVSNENYTIEQGEKLKVLANLILKYYTIEQGEKLKVLISLIPKYEKERLNVTLNYIIKDNAGKIYLTKNETIFVEGQVEFERDFDIEMLPLGEYIIELVYPGGVAPLSAEFNVIEKKKPICCFFGMCNIIGFEEFLNICWYWWIIIILIIILIRIMIYLVKRKKRYKFYSNNNRNSLKIPSLRIKTLIRVKWIWLNLQ